MMNNTYITEEVGKMVFYTFGTVLAIGGLTMAGIAIKTIYDDVKEIKNDRKKEFCKEISKTYKEKADGTNSHNNYSKLMKRARYFKELEHLPSSEKELKKYSIRQLKRELKEANSITPDPKIKCIIGGF